ncbi:MAG: LysM peptidoglycan-binding domain-containing protein [Marinobacter sp.]
MPQHKVLAGETLSGIAAQYQVSLDAMQAENPIIKDVNDIEAGWTLSVPESSASKNDMPAAQSANDDTTDDVECSDCALECVALVQVTGEDDAVYALTETQFRHLNDEIEILNAPMAELKKAEEGNESDIPAAREKTWKKLRELGALPRPEHSTTAEELLKEYEVRWQREQARLEHQRRRKERIEYEIDQIRRQILFPASQRNLTEPKDRLSVKVFVTFCGELETTLTVVEDRISAHEEATVERREELTRMERRLKLLRAALEAEVRYRVAKNSGDTTPAEVEQLSYEANELKQSTLWPNYISEKDVNDLVRKQQRLNELGDERIPYRDCLERYMEEVSNTVTLIALIAVMHRARTEKHRQRQEERRSLMVDIEKTLTRLVNTSSSAPVEQVARPQIASMRAHPLVEVKHTGTGGYRYMRREVGDQLRRNWKPLKTADVRAAMAGKEFKRAWGEARESLKANTTLKLKLKEWKSKEDNFFNQLEVELLKKEAATTDGRFAASAEAQMFRFAAQCGLEAAYDPKKQEAYIGGQMQGAYSLLQGEATLKAKLPDGKGSRLILRYENHEGVEQEVHCGYFRTDAEYCIRGFAGACASLAARARVSSAPGEVGISGETNGEAFAGASVSNEASFGVKWKAAYQEVEGTESSEVSEAQDEADSDYKSLVEVKPELAVSAGIGAGFDYKIVMSEGKIVACLKGSVVLGAGGGGGVAAELNGEQIWELVKFIRWSLEKSDFRFLDWIEEGAFEHLTFLLKAFVFTKADFTNFVDQGIEKIESFWEGLNKADTRVRDAGNSIIASSDVHKLMPGAKAEVLGILMKDSSATLSFEDPYRELADEAAIKVLETVKSDREFIEILKRIGNDGKKGGFQDLKNNYSKLIIQRLFRSAQAQRTEAWLSNLYA